MRNPQLSVQSKHRPIKAGAAGSDLVLSQHETNLVSLRAVYAKLVTLSGKSAELEQDRRNVEHSVEAIAERLLQAPDPEVERELAGLDTQLTSLKAQAEFNSRVQRTAETELQKRLPADITACERTTQLRRRFGQIKLVNRRILMARDIERVVRGGDRD